MEGDIGDICQPGVRQAVGVVDRHWFGAQSARADMDRETGNRWARSRPDRGGARLDDCPWLSDRREPGALARSSRQAAAGALESTEGEASLRAALYRAARFSRCIA